MTLVRRLAEAYRIDPFGHRDMRRPRLRDDIVSPALTPRSRARVVTRRAGDLLLIERAGGEPASRSSASRPDAASTDVVECAAVVTRRDGSRASMRLRLPRGWIEDAARLQAGSSDAIRERSDVVGIRQYAGVAAVRLGDVARNVGVESTAAVPGWLAEARRLIEGSVRAPVPMRRIAEQLGVHPVYLSRAFRRCFGMTASAYLAKCKLERACGAIMEDRASMSSVAMDSGFADQSHMSRSVVAALKLTPSELRRRCHSSLRSE